MEYDINLFDEHYVYNDYVLVNEIYEDEDHRSNTWAWGKLVQRIHGRYVEDPKILTGVSSNSYGSFDEIYEAFKREVNNVGL
jgi:hypothetical protein